MLSSPGLGSGLDVNGIVGQLMSLEQRPLMLLSTRETKQQAQLSAFGSLKGALSTFQTGVNALAKPSLFTGLTATLADTSLATVSAASNAAAGSHEIQVTSLAQAQKIKSEAFASTSTAVGSGSLTIEFGRYDDDGLGNVTFSNHPEKAATTITIDPAKSTLAEIRAAINEADAGVTASIINDGGGNRLVIASKDTGLDHALKITVNDSDSAHTDNDGLSQLAFDATTGGTTNMTETVSAKNAAMVIDGIAISKSSNTISDALEGVTFNLTKADLSVTTSLTVSRDTASVQKAVGEFVKAYNDLETTINNLSRFNAESRQGSILTGDSTVRAVQNRMRSLLTTAQTDTANGISTLSQIGVSFQKDGTLALDNDKLTAVLNDPTKDIASFFAGQTADSGASTEVTTTASNGFAGKLNTFIDGLLRSDGLIDGRMDGINASIKDIGKQQEALALRLEGVERRIRAQFTALDTLIASMGQTSSFLQQQLASLPGARQ